MKPEQWILSRDVGTSSRTIWAVMTGLVDSYVDDSMTFDVPHDKDKKTRGSNPKEGVADTKGKRYAVASEVQDGKRLDIGLLKDMSGQDSIKARRLYEHEVEFLPTHKLWMFGNHKPIITDTTHAAWRRLKLIPFNYQVPENEIDDDLQVKLEIELPGILNWAIAGCLEWQSQKLSEPTVVTDAVAQYRHDSDILADFIEDCCIMEHMANVSKSELKEAYENWCKENGQEPVTRNTFKNRILEKGISERRSSDGNIRLWVGIRKRTDSDRQTPDISDKTPGDFVANLTKQTEFPIKSPREEQKSNTLQETDKTFVSDAPAELPNCPKCGLNEWAAGKENYICPCGYTMPLGGSKQCLTST